jgi:hypothetical protein
MIIYEAEIADGISELISTKSSISYAALIEPLDSKDELKPRLFKTLASIKDTDLYYTQSILVSSSWNKNDDIFDKAEVWQARHSPEHKPTNLEHDESTIIGHIVSNYPITDDGILIDENTPIENLPDKYHILTGAVIYKSYTKPELKDRTEALIQEIENGSKYVSMECFFKGFDYGLIDKTNGTYKVLARNNNTAYLTKYLRAYGGMGEHENYKIGRVLRNITFSGKGYVDKPANPDSIIFSKNSFKFLKDEDILEKNDDISNSGVTITQSNTISENKTMSKQADTVVATDCAEAAATAEAVATELKAQIESLQVSHAEAINSLTTEKNQLASQHEEAIQAMTQKYAELETTLSSTIEDLNKANESIAAYMKKEKKMMRKAALVETGFEDAEIESVLEKFESVNDETFAAMTEMMKMKMKKKKEEEKNSKAEEVKQDLVDVLETVEETTDVALTVGGEDDSAVENTRAALVDFVRARLGKTTK